MRYLSVFLLCFLICMPAFAGPPFESPTWKPSGTDAIIPATSARPNVVIPGSVTIGTADPLMLDTDGDGTEDTIIGDYAVDLAATDTYTIALVGGDYLFDIDQLDSDCTVTLPEASLWVGKTIGVCLSTSDATHDLLLDPGDATDTFVDFARAGITDVIAGDYIGADGANECVYLMSVGDDMIIILNSASTALPSGWVAE